MSQPMQFGTYPSLRDRVVVISGGASGIGEGIVEAFAEQGARVAFLDILDDAANALVERLAGKSVKFYHCDLLDIGAVKQACAQIVDELGTVDVLVNNAGNDTRHDLEAVTEEMWDRTLNLNVRHQFFLAQALLPGMRAQKRGSIINLSSIAWMIPSTDLPAYVTSKSSIIGLTRALAHRVGMDGVRVNSVSPGCIWTERQRKLWFTPEYAAQMMERQALKIELQPADVARMILFLAADDSAGISNQSFVVDGGWV
ncbi:SDR family NAD(P)-dependent oxidoreductase [Terriglobus roseus]|nr:SDR family oxidoreductase [Terriglobus roseus]